MNKRTRNTLILVGVLTVAALITGTALKRRRQRQEDAVASFGALLNRVQNRHPKIYAWYNALPTSQQIQIENSMTPEFLKYLYKEFRKEELSAEIKERLRRAGYYA